MTVDAAPIALEDLEILDPMVFHRNEHWDSFRRLRAEDPVHFRAESRFGPFWSITRYQDILEVDSNHKVFSSAGAVSLDDFVLQGPAEDAVTVGGFIAMDPPDHDVHRKILSPALGPSSIAKLENLIRERTAATLAELPLGEEFDWVASVSQKLTMLMLATVMGFPPDRLDELKLWSDAIAGVPGDGRLKSWNHRETLLKEMSRAFLALRDERRLAEPGADLISKLAKSPDAADMSDEDFVSDIALLIVGGNDTTSNSMSGGIVAFHRYPDQWTRLMENPDLVSSTVPEIIRWQTPVMYQSRRATQDYELGGKTIRAGDKVAMWYVSGNRDETAIEDAESFIIDRPRPRQHLSFGFGLHRCLGNRLAEMQIRVLWEEIIQAGWKRIEVTGEPFYTISNTTRGIEHLPVRIHV